MLVTNIFPFLAMFPITRATIGWSSAVFFPVNLFEIYVPRAVWCCFNIEHKTPIKFNSYNFSFQLKDPS